MTEPNAEPRDSNAALEEQQELLENSLPAAFSAYDAAKQQGIVEPVIFLLDCEDEIGREIASSWLGNEAIEDAIEQRQLSDADEEDGSVTTVFAHAFPLEQCRREVPTVFPYLKPVFNETLPENSFLAIVVASGGASALTVPLAARDSS